MSPSRTRLAIALSAAGLLALTACSSGSGDSETEAVDYPTRAVEVVIPFGAGGSTDIASRAIAEVLAEDLGQPFNPSNQPGAQQVTAVSAVVGAAADGYTLLADGAGSSTIQSLLEGIPYEWDDRSFIAKVASGAHVYAVGAGAGITTLDELAEQAQADPSAFTVAWLSGTSTSDFATLQLLDAIGVDPDEVTKVPFTGSGDAMQAAAAGDVDLATGGSSAIASLYSSGDLVPLALTAPDPNFPEIALTADEGYPELDMTYWVGLSGPAGMPDGVVSTLTGSLEGSAATLTDTFEALGMTVDIVIGDELATQIADEAELFAGLNALAG